MAAIAAHNRNTFNMDVRQRHVHEFWRTAMTFADYMNTFVLNKYCPNAEWLSLAGWLQSIRREYNVPKTLTHFQLFRK